ncbi:hypothetical protein FQR65_LT15606 [Abscondita terminalis]|nr:hypothetical protein FQR65_LT15606 [Abscondita terminalis]
MAQNPEGKLIVDHMQMYAAAQLTAWTAIQSLHRRYAGTGWQQCVYHGKWKSKKGEATTGSRDDKDMRFNVTIILVCFGYMGYSFLAVREYPSIDPAIVSCSRTNMPGPIPDIIESQITEPLEKFHSTHIDGIRNITSSSSQGSSNITVEFELEKKPEEAANGYALIKVSSGAAKSSTGYRTLLLSFKAMRIRT